MRRRRRKQEPKEPIYGIAALPEATEPVTPGHYEAQVAQLAADVGVDLGKDLDEDHEPGYEVEQVMVCVSYRQADGEVLAWRALYPARTSSSVGLIEAVRRKLGAVLD